MKSDTYFEWQWTIDVSTGKIDRWISNICILTLKRLSSWTRAIFLHLSIFYNTRSMSIVIKVLWQYLSKFNINKQHSFCAWHTTVWPEYTKPVYSLSYSYPINNNKIDSACHAVFENCIPNISEHRLTRRCYNIVYSFT